MLLVDRIVEKSEDHAKAIKNVTASEIFFLGHFPAYPIYPGFLIIDGLAHTAGLMLLNRGESVIPVFAGIDNARFKSEVRPGDVLEYEVWLKERKLGMAKVEAIAKVQGKIVATATLLVGVRKNEK